MDPGLGFEDDDDEKEEESDKEIRQLKILSGTLTVSEPVAQRTRSKTRSKNMDTQFQGPLLASPGGGTIYQPWSHRDMEALVNKLPPLTKGGQKWIMEMEKFTAGDQLCLGDIRALMGRIEGRLRVQEMDEKAGSTRSGDETPFNRHRTAYWTALRATFPTTRTLTALASLKKEVDEEMHTFLNRCEDVWQESTGERYDSTEATVMLWRNAVLKSLPLQVQAKLEDIVGLDTMSDERWRAHLVHHDNKHKKTQGDNDEELKTLTKRLLKMQVAEKDNEVNKIKKERKQMVVGSTTPIQQPDAVATPAPAPLPSWPVWPGSAPSQPPFQQPIVILQPKRGGFNRSRGRGRSLQSTGCYTCGNPGHWAKDCPQQLQQQYGQTYQQSAPTQQPYGPPQQQYEGTQNNYRGRGGHPQQGKGRGYPGYLPNPPNVQQMPLTAWEATQWDPTQQ